MFLYWSFITLQWVLNYQKVKILINSKLYEPTSNLKLLTFAEIKMTHSHLTSNSRNFF